MQLIEEVVELVGLFYSPASSPSQIAAAQKRLQAIQKSAEGWTVAGQLLAQPSLDCKFFGSLTYTVSLNQRLGALAEAQDHQALAQCTAQLMAQLLRLVADDEVVYHGGLFVVKKMLSNVALLYIAGYQYWKDPLSSYGVCLGGGALDTEAVVTDIPSLLASLSPKHIQSLLLLSQILVEELIKKEVTRADRAQIHRVVRDQIFATTEKLLLVLGADGLARSPLAAGWLDCLSSWIAYASKAEFDSLARYNFNPLLQIAIRLVALPTPWQSEASERALDTLVDALDTSTAFFNADSKQMLEQLVFGSWGAAFLANMADQSEQFARLVILFLTPETLNLALRLTDDANDCNLDFLLRLTDFPGSPVVDETISSEFIEFWMQFTDAFLDDTKRFSELLKDDPQKLARFNDKARALFFKISQIYWSKIHVPMDESELDGLTEEFRVYRRDVADLFESLFPIVRIPLFRNLVDIVMANVMKLDDPNRESLEPAVHYGLMADIESSLYLLNAVSADFSDASVPPEVVSDIGRVLDSSCLQLVTLYRTPGQFQHVVYTTIRFVASVDWFYKSTQGLGYLPQILNFLFDTMADPQYQLISSKAIADICDNCRQSLQDSLPNFKGIVSQMVTDVDVEPLTRQRIINSYASIVQGLQDPALQGDALHELFDLLGKRSFEVISQLDSVANESVRTQMLDYVTSLISSVAAIGRGMQLPDSADEVYTEQQLAAVNTYWAEDPLKIHAQVLAIVENFSLVSDLLVDDLGIANEIASLFKSGMTEEVLGPFVFDYTVITQFVVTKFRTLTKSYNTYPALYDLYSQVVRAHHSQIAPESVTQTLEQIYIAKIDVIRADPDITQSVLSLFATILGSTPALLIWNHDMLEHVLGFGIEQLASNERFVLRALDSFWTKLIHLRRGTHQDTMAIRRLFNETRLGHMLTFNVLKYLLATPRSTVEFFTEILKSLVSKYSMLVKGWLQDAFVRLNEERAAAGQKQVDNYELFIKKILITRGTRAANTLIQDFWLDVNGLTHYHSVEL